MTTTILSTDDGLSLTRRDTPQGLVYRLTIAGRNGRVESAELTGIQMANIMLALEAEREERVSSSAQL